MSWVKLSQYCRLSGDTPEAVYTKRRRGIWLEGREAKIAGDGSLWVSLDAVNEWVKTSSPALRSGAGRPKTASGSISLSVESNAENHSKWSRHRRTSATQRD